MIKGRYHPSADDRIGILKAIRYEITMLLAWPTFPNAEKYAQNVILESRLIHARALHEFFTRNANPHVYDVRPEDFDFAPRKVGVQQAQLNRMNQDLAHISYRRLDRKKPEDWIWATPDYIDPLRKVCIDFCQHIVDNYAESIGEDELKHWTLMLSWLRKTGWVRLEPRPDTVGFYSQDARPREG